MLRNNVVPRLFVEEKGPGTNILHMPRYPSDLKGFGYYSANIPPVFMNSAIFEVSKLKTQNLELSAVLHVESI